MLPTGANLKQIPASVWTAVKVSQARRPENAWPRGSLRSAPLFCHLAPLRVGHSSGIHTISMILKAGSAQLCSWQMPTFHWLSTDSTVRSKCGRRAEVPRKGHETRCQEAGGPQQWVQPAYTPTNRMNFSGTLSCGWNKNNTGDQEVTQVNKFLAIKVPGIVENGPTMLSGEPDSVCTASLMRSASSLHCCVSATRSTTTGTTAGQKYQSSDKLSLARC